MRIGLISDTHGHLAAEVFDLFAGVDFIIHAGDIGKEEVLIELASIAEVKAVLGNTDRYPLQSKLKNIVFFERENIKFCVTHIVPSVKTFAFQLFKMNQKADVVVFGHTHKPTQIMFNEILFVNPGSATLPRHIKKRSVALLTVESKSISVDFKYF